MTSLTASPEYAALTTGAGVVVLEGWTTVGVTGADRATLLHNMCTADLKSLTPGQGCEAFFTDVKGKIVAHAYVLAGAEKHWLVGVPEQAAQLVAHLDRYIIREDVQLADESSALAWTLIAGPESAAIVGRVVSDANFTNKLSAPWSHHEVGLAGTTVEIARCNLPWAGGYLAACPTAAVGELLSELAADGVVSVAQPAWNTLRVESGWPLLEVDFDGSNLPQEIGRDAQAINFRKGCYLGQETIARIDALGHVNKRLATVRFSGDAPPAVGAELMSEGSAVGVVTSACWSLRLGAPLALAMVRRGHNEPGSRLTCSGETAVVVPTPAVGA